MTSPVLTVDLVTIQRRPGARQNRIILAIPVRGAAFWERLVREWRERGLQVSVWSECDEQTYRNRRNRAEAIWLRVRLNLFFPARVLFRAVFSLRRRTEMLLVPTTPFYLPALAARLLRRRASRVIHLLYDLYPDALVLAGKVRKGTLPDRIFSRVTRASLRRSAATVFLGRRLREYAENEYARSPHGRIIPVGADGNLFQNPPRSPTFWERTVLYVGNLGYLHDVDTLARLFADGLPAGLQFRFHASGAGNAALRNAMAGLSPETAAQRQVQFGPPLPEDQWVATMEGAEIGLVTMRAGVENVLFPSKVYSAMMAGQAILAICPAASDLACMIAAEDCGWVVEPGDVAALRRVLVEIMDRPDTVLRKRQNAFRAGHDKFDMRPVADLWCQLFDELSEEH